MIRLFAAHISLSLAVALTLGCGGATTGKDGANPEGGSSSGGRSATGGRPATGGGSATGGSGGTACCTAAPICKPGELQIAGPAECPATATCYENRICCSSIWCASSGAQCNAIPTCDPEDRELQGACPPAYSCYTRTLCGTTIVCLDQTPDGGPEPVDAGAPADAGACSPDAEWYRHYVATSPSQCALIDYGCAANTFAFSNACGCGCQQDASCPEWADCMPGPGAQNPLCTPEGRSRCPFTKIAF